MKKINLDDAKSILKMNNIYVKQFKFERKDNINVDDEPKYQIGKEIIQKEENTFLVSLITKVSHESFELELAVTGEFQVDDMNVNEVLIYKNSISILFPYLRSELTILTSQPNMEPIVLPPININMLFELTQD